VLSRHRQSLVEAEQAAVGERIIPLDPFSPRWKTAPRATAPAPHAAPTFRARNGLRHLEVFEVRAEWMPMSKLVVFAPDVTCARELAHALVGGERPPSDLRAKRMPDHSPHWDLQDKRLSGIGCRMSHRRTCPCRVPGRNHRPATCHSFTGRRPPTASPHPPFTPLINGRARHVVGAKPSTNYPINDHNSECVG